MRRTNAISPALDIARHLRRAHAILTENRFPPMGVRNTPLPLRQALRHLLSALLVAEDPKAEALPSSLEALLGLLPASHPFSFRLDPLDFLDRFEDGHPKELAPTQQGDVLAAYFTLTDLVPEAMRHFWVSLDGDAPAMVTSPMRPQGRDTAAWALLTGRA